MRANEFAVEGLGDWMQGQVLSRKQIDQKKAQKANAPKITKAVSEILTMQVTELATRAKESGKQISDSDIADTVVSTLKKTLKVDPMSGDFEDMTQEIIASAKNPAKFANDISVVKNIEAMVEIATAPGQKQQSTAYEVKAQVYYPATKEGNVVTLIDGEYALLRKVSGKDVYELKTEYQTRDSKEEIVQFIAKDGATKNKPDNTGIFVNSVLTPINTKLGNKVFRITPE